MSGRGGEAEVIHRYSNAEDALKNDIIRFNDSEAEEQMMKAFRTYGF